MKKTLALILITLSTLGILLSGCTQQTPNNEPTVNHIAVIDTTLGIIRVQLYEDLMPITTANFIQLADDGFYNGLIFHRIGSGFMIQGGGFYPNMTLKTDPYNPIQLETHPNATHVDGAISMARTSDPNSATSQFFICDGPQHFLDNNYAAFGVVIEGLDVVHTIATQPQDNSGGDGTGKPLTDIIINSITIENP